MFSFHQRVLTLLQFTRMALVFTAISNGWASMLLQRQATGEPIPFWYAVAMTIASVGLYTFGMSLNDVIDRRRDSQIAPGRPLPSGRISVRAAHAVCVMLALIAMGAGAWMAILKDGQWISLLIVMWTMLLIVFYDFAGKYLVPLGLLSLGLIRFFHAAAAAPRLDIPWHAVLLLVHVTVLSTICYRLEGKRPRLKMKHMVQVGALLAMMVAGLIALLIEWRSRGDWPAALFVTPALIYPAASAAGFVGLATIIRLRTPDPRAAGRSMMLYGLLWLIVYDACFVLGYVGWHWSLVILSLLPISMLAVQVMRGWARVVELSAKPQYQRAR